jgi:cardiolipin synthase
VRVIYDDVGNFSVRQAFFERMREAGIDVHAFMPVRFPAFTSKINYRNHRKLCVVDGQVGFIGGMNIALRYVKGTEIPWRDTHLRIRGKAVFGIQTAFLLDWYFVDRSMVSGKAYFPEPEGVPRNGCLTQIVTSSPTSEWPELSQGYVRILMNARDYVYIETPDFMPTEPVLFALCTCALSGVDVRLVVPKRGETKWVGWASRSYYNEVLQAGVKIFLYEGGYNHSKLLVCDDTVCSCGSANVDFRSFENNFEANAFIYDADTVLSAQYIESTDDVRHLHLSAVYSSGDALFEAHGDIFGLCGGSLGGHTQHQEFIVVGLRCGILQFQTLMADMPQVPVSAVGV